MDVAFYEFFSSFCFFCLFVKSETVAESQEEVAFYQTARPRDDVMTSRASLYTFKVNLIIYFVNKYTTQWPSRGGRWPRTRKYKIQKIATINIIILKHKY